MQTRKCRIEVWEWTKEGSDLYVFQSWDPFIIVLLQSQQENSKSLLSQKNAEVESLKSKINQLTNEKDQEHQQYLQLRQEFSSYKQQMSVWFSDRLDSIDKNILRNHEYEWATHRGEDPDPSFLSWDSELVWFCQVWLFAASRELSATEEKCILLGDCLFVVGLCYEGQPIL